MAESKRREAEHIRDTAEAGRAAAEVRREMAAESQIRM
jgi:hypothetical protein